MSCGKLNLWGFKQLNSTIGGVIYFDSRFQERTCQIEELKVSENLPISGNYLRWSRRWMAQSFSHTHLNIENQVDQHRQIDECEHDLEPGDVTDNFKELPG
jgi:hypothetical protein